MSRDRLLMLHTNDMHGRLGWRHTSRLGQLKQEHAPCLLLDAGDAVAAGNLDIRPWGEPILDRMNAARYDAMALGNREFHPWRFALRLKIKRALFPVLCANLRSRWGDDRAGVRPASLQTLRDGTKVGLFGLLVEMVRPATWGARVSSFVVEEAVATAQKWAAQLRRQADWVICLSHLGWEQDRRLAESVPGLDAIIGGHSHTPLARPQQVGSVWIVQAEPYADAVGRLLLRRHGDRVHAEGDLIPLP